MSGIVLSPEDTAVNSNDGEKTRPSWILPSSKTINATKVA